MKHILPSGRNNISVDLQVLEFLEFQGLGTSRGMLGVRLNRTSFYCFNVKCFVKSC